MGGGLKRKHLIGCLLLPGFTVLAERCVSWCLSDKRPAGLSLGPGAGWRPLRSVLLRSCCRLSSSSERHWGETGVCPFCSSGSVRSGLVSVVPRVDECL